MLSVQTLLKRDKWKSFTSLQETTNFTHDKALSGSGRFMINSGSRKVTYQCHNWLIGTLLQNKASIECQKKHMEVEK
jgi:hypothetical protein